MFFVGTEYGRGAQRFPIITGCEQGPKAIYKIYSNHQWSFITPTWEFNKEECLLDRFGENIKIQKMIYDFFKSKNKDFIKNHIFIGGDHSLNFAHFKAIADTFPNEEIALIYIDAHFDIHTPESSKKEASGSPHGTNVRHLLGYGDDRYLNLGKKITPLKKENLFFIGARSYEQSEINFVNKENIFTTNNKYINDITYLTNQINEILKKINNKKYILSFDFDVIDPKEFTSVQVPEKNGINLQNLYKILPLLNTQNLLCTEFVEFAPNFDKLGNSSKIVKNIIDNFIK